MSGGLIRTAITGLAEAVMESAKIINLVDQTRENLRTTSVILETVANYVQEVKDSDTDDVVRAVKCTLPIVTM